MPKNPPRMAVLLDEYLGRVDRTKAWMSGQNIDILVLSQPEHYNWLTGFEPTSVFYYQPLFVTADEQPLTLLCNKAELVLCEETCWVDDVRTIWTFEDYVERTVEVIRERGFGDKPFILGMNLSSYHLHARIVLGIREKLPNAKIVDVSLGLDDLRLIKSPAEIKHLRRAAHIADLGVTAGINAIREGVTDREVMAAIQHALALNGGEFPAYPTLVDARGTLHGTPTGHVLEKGDAIYLEVSGVYRRYHCNISRTVVVGEPSEKVKKLYDLVSETLERATEMLRPGVPVADIVAYVDEAQGEYRGNTWGRFGFSMEIAYPPIWIGALSLMKGDAHVIEPGIVITMEPGLSYADGVTMMLGNNVLVTENGPEVLNNVPVELFSK